MAEQSSGYTRRTIIRAAVMGACAGPCLPMPRALAADKMTPAAAEYRAAPNGIYSCGMCSLFEPPSSCKVVDGEISKDGWCKAFVLAD
jgi:hypothetical protein